MEAIIDGTFWTNKDFDGDRQRLFFPAYRLLRILGNNHAEAWDIINKHVHEYKKQNEIGYWISREHSELIENIDDEIDDYIADMEANDEH